MRLTFNFKNTIVVLIVMSGIYIHIPFCKQACHYCDFHFSTSLTKKEAMLEAIMKELVLRKNEINKNAPIQTIYFGGGTPSVLEVDEMNRLIDQVYDNFQVVSNPEITLEANPDDLSLNKINGIVNTPINRLSIGIQSFYEEDLKLMNRAHNVSEAERCILEAQDKGITNISIDLIYGIPEMNTERWNTNIEKALSFKIPHISSYALTVEPKTALEKLIAKGIIKPVDDELAHEHFLILGSVLEENGLVHYELSNFGKPGFFSKNNTAYWQGKTYLGIGPSAHSFDGKQRAWNVANNPIYIKSISKGELPIEREILSIKDRYNEYIMTGLRTMWGVSLKKLRDDFGTIYEQYFIENASRHIQNNLLEIIISENSDAVGEIVRTTKEGKFLSDGIASDLFLVNFNS